MSAQRCSTSNYEYYDRIAQRGTPYMIETLKIPYARPVAATIAKHSYSRFRV